MVPHSELVYFKAQPLIEAMRQRSLAISNGHQSLDAIDCAAEFMMEYSTFWKLLVQRLPIDSLIDQLKSYDPALCTNLCTFALMIAGELPHAHKAFC